MYSSLQLQKDVLSRDSCWTMAGGTGQAKVVATTALSFTRGRRMLRAVTIPALEVDLEEGPFGAMSNPEKVVWSMLGHETLLGVGGLLNTGMWWWG